jgi:pimeloyl-ACP methyl ester carboxylesterase
LNFNRAAPVVAPKPAAPSQIDGTWLGTLDTGAIKLRIVFKIVNTTDGLTVQLQSPDQNPNWMPATSTTRNENKLTVTFKGIGGVYEGKIAADFNSIDGTFTQMGNPLQLNLKRIKNQSELERPRPQTPVKPYPYREEDVAFKSAGNSLGATLTIPPGKGPFPAVLLIAGSGPHDRDESLIGHKPFLVLSDYLTRKGIVVLRADKRGTGKSTGDYANATTADFAVDAEAGVAFLKTRAKVDPHKIGLVGHSEGGVVAPMAAVADPDVAFIVMMAGSAVPGDQIIVEQTRLISEAGGVSKEKADADAVKEAETLAVVKDEKDPATRDRLLGIKLAAEGVPEAQLGAEIKQLNSPWFRYFINYDPTTALRKLTIPVLAINGSLDLQVPPAQNLPPIRKALAEAGNQHAEVDELPGLNHLFQDSKTGAPAEYSQIEETISPLALDKIASWILKQ